VTLNEKRTPVGCGGKEGVGSEECDILALVATTEEKQGPGRGRRDLFQGKTF